MPKIQRCKICDEFKRDYQISTYMVCYGCMNTIPDYISTFKQRLKWLRIKIKKASRKMKPIVNKEECVGCELCVQTCPEVFDMENSLAITKVDRVPCEVKEQCVQAMEECPVECIILEGYHESKEKV